MVKIRLRRVGAKGNPKYRLVVADSRAARDGQFIEILGYWDPIPEKELLHIDQDKVKAWLKKGALPSVGALRLFYKTGLMPRPDYAKPAAKEPAAKTAAAAPAAKEKKKEKAPAAPEAATKPEAEPAPKEKK